MAKFSKSVFIFVLITSWVFSSWPQFFDFPPDVYEAFANHETLRPNAAGNYQAWTTFGSGSAHWDRVDNASADDTNGVEVTGSTSDKETNNLTDPTFDASVEINSVTAYARCKAPGGGGAKEKVVILWRDNNTTTEVESATSNVDRDNFVDYSESRTTNIDGGSWTKTNIQNLEIGSRASTLGNTETIQCSEYWVTVTYDDHYMAAYRWFANTDTTDVGSALATQDTAVTLGAAGDAFRLRLALHVTGDTLVQNGHDMKLQFATQVGTCDISYTDESYADVTASTVIAYNNNATPTDGADLIDNANDPVHSGHINVNQDYEELNNFTNTVSAISAGDDGLWDFSLIDNSAPSNTTYCFRVIAADGELPAAPIVIPQITIAGGVVYSVSLSGGTISFGFVDLGASTTTVNNGYQQTATNTGDDMKLNVMTSVTAGGSPNWDNQSTIALNKYKLEVSTTSGSSWMTFQGNDTYLTASSSMAAGNSEILDFRFTAPSSSGDFVEKTFTITVQASAP